LHAAHQSASTSYSTSVPSATCSDRFVVATPVDTSSGVYHNPQLPVQSAVQQPHVLPTSSIVLPSPSSTQQGMGQLIASQALPPSAIPTPNGYYIPYSSVLSVPASTSQTAPAVQPQAPVFFPVTTPQFNSHLPPVNFQHAQPLPAASILASSSRLDLTLGNQFHLPSNFQCPKFFGKSDADLETFLQQIEVDAQGYHSTDTERFTMLKVSLHGNAATFMRAYRYCSPEDYMKYLRTQFGTQAYKTSNQAQLRRYRRKPDEPISQVKRTIKSYSICY
jgi:hypothetical protein